MHPETQYVFFSMLELGELTAEVPLVLSLIERKNGTHIDLDSMMDSPKVSFGGDIKKLVEDYYEMASSIERSLIGYNFIMESHTQLGEVVQGVENSLKRIYLDNDSRDMLILSGLEDDSPELSIKKRSMREVMLVRSQRSIMESDSRISSFLADFKLKFERYSSNISHTLQEAMEYLYKEEHQEAASILREAFPASPEGVLPSSFGDPFCPSSLNFAKPKKKKRDIKKVRRVFNKSVEALSKFLGPSDTKSFINGKEFRLEGEKYNYLLRSTGGLMSKTEHLNNHSIQYDLELYSKNWVFYANLCVAFPGSPVLDQVLSVYLMVKSGQEEDLIRNSNLFRRSDELYLDGYLVELKGLKKRSFDRVFGAPKTRREVFFDSKRPQLKVRIQNTLLGMLGVPRSLGRDLFNQELSFDERLDYVGVGIPMPRHLDFLSESESVLV